jgi:hypothetical protein
VKDLPVIEPKEIITTITNMKTGEVYKDDAEWKATTELLTQPLVMEEGEILKVQAADANELHVIASILEIQPREVTT